MFLFEVSKHIKNKLVQRVSEWEFKGTSAHQGHILKYNIAKRWSFVIVKRKMTKIPIMIEGGKGGNVGCYGYS